MAQRFSAAFEAPSLFCHPERSEGAADRKFRAERSGYGIWVAQRFSTAFEVPSLFCHPERSEGPVHYQPPHPWACLDETEARRGISCVSQEHSPEGTE